METSNVKRLEGLSEKIFLDRYAWKNADTSNTKVGDIVLVLTKDDPKFPVKEVGEVIAREGSVVTVRLRSGELVKSSIEKLTLTIEKTPEEMWDRLAGAMASVENEPDKKKEWQERFRYILDDWKLVPGGRIAAGAGASEELTLFNCYVVPSPKDSRGGIITTLSEMTEIMARGGGVGMNLSSLRPRRAIVAGVNGSSSGAVSWGGLFSYTTGLIEQGGSRRGALMLMLNDWHPDILEFITVKQTMGQVTNANLSVCVSNAFMQAVKEDLDWELVFPDTKEAGYDELWNGDLEEWKRLGRKIIPYKTVRAREIWQAIIESAWKSAEPGVVFMEYYNQMSNSWYFNPIISTNPCFHPESRISTEFGMIRIEDLYKRVGNMSFNIFTDNRLVRQANVVGGRSYEAVGTDIQTATVYPTEIKQTIKITLSNGMNLKVTPEHRIYTTSGWKEAQHLTQEDTVYIQSGAGQFADHDHLGKDWGMFLGWLTGDGWLSKRGDIGMVFGQDDEEVIPLMIEAGKKFSGAEAKVYKRENGTSHLFWWRKAFREQLIEIGIKAVPAGEKEVPNCIFTASKETIVAYLQALFSADGTVYDKDVMHRSVRLTSSSIKLLQDVQLLMINFGIHGHIYNRNKKQQKLFTYTSKNGEQRTYQGKPFFELVISGNNIVVFKEEIGFKFIVRKQLALEGISRRSRKSEKFISKVVSITNAELVQVYDINEPVTNTLIANGMVVHNCGEQGLPGWGVCNLSAVNLSKFFDEERHDVAWEELGKVTRWSVRFLDNVIDKTPYHFEENERNQKLERRIGLGTMGLAELMIKLGIRYGSAESLVFMDKLYAFMARESYLASTEIASEKGSFQAFDADKYVKSGFMKHMIEQFPEIGEAVADKGMRNVTVITQAPTGSTGTMVGTSTGIEPYFAFEYYRQSRLGYDKQDVPIAAAWKESHPGEELPEYFVTSMSLSAEDHIRVQATIQRWVDSSISKTANCPADFTVEETGRLYELAFELGCKGVTIYRDGSRDVQVLSTTKDKGPEHKAGVTTNEQQSAALSSPNVDSEDYFDADLVEAAVPAIQSERVLDKQYKRRPQVLRGATYKVNTPFGMAYITINDLIGTPGEIFLNVGKAGSDVFAMAEALGRVCSLFLRYGDHGNKVKLLIKHLKGIGGSGAIGFGANRVESIADAVAKSLELHMESGEEHSAAAELIPVKTESKNYQAVEGSSRDLCPSCGSASLINIEGCKQCANCGFSKC
ncbi:LAGLIDADG family homing endonuclease [Paenibacillus sp. LHD-38]|uniref:LAGLIDADG family homing endonuclease n=1 Tax=Paenibacillus sp. LHD-38 TaxID=3072143 RepID=UPI00280DBB9E|nr:LAGLIDADG family homing endonuclease [Paenibacillus sp. LHD-38]MDQ8736779.1 LAGLIDADG family homing endonuclease [Paenibacillus sp. LHD-38]